ncbi:MAG: hypothetical protein AAGH46_06305, partial [Bacteroidota bacterium]
MDIKFLYPHWGSEHLGISEFFKEVSFNGFDGIEINIPKDSVFETEFYDGILQQRRINEDFIIVAQQVFGVKKESPEDYLQKVINRLESLV